MPSGRVRILSDEQRAERKRTRDASYYIRNRDSIKKRVARYRKKHPEKTSRAVKEWVSRNPERRKQILRKSSQKRKPYLAEAAMRRYATKLRASPMWANRFFVTEAYHLAALRTKITGFKWHVDHIVPLVHDKVCGLHTEHNLRVIPAQLNWSKNNRYSPDMRST